MWLSSVALLPCCPAFPHRHFPLQSPPSHSFDLSLHSQQQPLPWDCSTILKLQFLATVPSRALASLSRVCVTVSRAVWFSFHLGCHRPAVSLSALNVPPLTQTIAQMWGSDPCFSSSSPPRAGWVLLTLLFFPLVPSSYWVLHASIYSFPLSALSWYSARTSVAEGVFLMYPWGERYSTPTYSSAILFTTVSSAQFPLHK